MNSYGNEQITMIYEYKPEIDLNKIQKQLGKGANGAVWMVDEGDGKKYAQKKILKEHVYRRMRKQEQKREIDLMAKIENPHVISFMGAYEDSKYITIKMEYAQGKNLRQFLLDNRQMSIKERRKFGVRFFLQCVNAMSALRTHRIMNRDIKPDNIMITKYENLDEFVIKMIDLGESKYANSCQNTMKVGTDAYMAPQVYRSNEYNELCDIWSLGVMLFQVFQGTLNLPDHSKSLNYPYSANMRQKFNASRYFQTDIKDSLILSVTLIPDPIRYLLRRMLNPSKQERISLVKILEYLNQNFEQLRDELGKSVEEERRKVIEIFCRQKLVVCRSEEEQKVGKKIKILHEQVYLPMKKELKEFKKTANLDVMIMMYQICRQLIQLQKELYSPFEQIYERDEYENFWMREYISKKESEQIQDDIQRLENSIQMKTKQKIHLLPQFRITQKMVQFIRQYFSIQQERMLRILHQILTGKQ